MDLSVIIESIIVLFIMILVGLYGSRRNIITDELKKGLINILIQIPLPFMIITSFLHRYDSNIKENIIKTFFYSLVAYILMPTISYLLLKPIKKEKRKILHFANIFVNTGYIGFPILHSMYGPEGVVYGSIFNMFFVLLVWTYGITIFKGNLTRKEILLELRDALLNPSILAVFLGILIMYFDIQLPEVLKKASREIGQLTGPLSMMIIGSGLAKVKIKKYLYDWTMYYGVAIKLIIIPIVIYFIATIIGLSSIPVNTVIIMTALPASAMTSIFAETFNKEKEYAAYLVSMTTLLSLCTIVFLIKYLLS